MRIFSFYQLPLFPRNVGPFSPHLIEISPFVVSIIVTLLFDTMIIPFFCVPVLCSNEINYPPEKVMILALHQTYQRMANLAELIAQIERIKCHPAKVMILSLRQVFQRRDSLFGIPVSGVWEKSHIFRFRCFTGGRGLSLSFSPFFSFCRSFDLVPIVLWSLR